MPKKKPKVAVSSNLKSKKRTLSLKKMLGLKSDKPLNKALEAKIDSDLNSKNSKEYIEKMPDFEGDKFLNIPLREERDSDLNSKLIAKIKDLLRLREDSNNIRPDSNESIVLHNLCAKIESTHLVKKIIKDCIASGSDVEINAATKLKRLEIVKLIIDKADLNKTDNKNDESPLNRAVQLDCVDLVEALIVAGADVNAHAGYCKRTPLHFAAVLGFTSILRKLIDKGADVDAYDRYKQTPLYLAVRSEHKAAVNWLIEKGANVTLPNGDGKTPSDLMKENNFINESTKKYVCMSFFTRLLTFGSCMNAVNTRIETSEYDSAKEDDEGKEKLLSAANSSPANNVITTQPGGSSILKKGVS